MIGVQLYRHITAIRVLLLAVGLWPYQRSKLTCIQRLLFSGILTSFIIFQLTPFATAKCTSSFVVKVLSSVLLFMIYLTIYNTFWFHIPNMRFFLEQIQNICYQLKDENEIAIIEKCAFIAKRYTKALILIGSLFLVLVQPIWQHIIDVFLFINDTHSHHTVLIVTEYFVDQEKYLYFIMLHTSAAFCIGVITALGTGIFFLIYLIHACGMFQIASYRIEQAVNVEIQRNISKRGRIKIYDDICYAVDIHRKAMKLCDLLISNYEQSLLILVVCSVSCLSLNMFRVFQIITIGGDVGEFFLHVAYVNAILVYMFILNYMGQKVTDYNNDVFLSTYNVRWYMIPLNMQKLILLLLQRGNKSYHLIFGGLIMPSLESFATLTSTSLSYFTVMYSMQE